MITTNGNTVVFSGQFSMKAGDEVVVAPPNLGRRIFRFIALENTSGEPGPSNIQFIDNELRLPIPLRQVGAISMENPFIGMIGTESLSLRCILQGAGTFTMVQIEIHLSKVSTPQ